MLEKIDLNKTVDKKSYRRVMDEASRKLGLLQRECKAAGIPVMIVFEGMGAAGKEMCIRDRDWWWRCTCCRIGRGRQTFPTKKVRPVKTNVLCTQIFSSKPIDILDKVRYYLHL